MRLKFAIAAVLLSATAVVAQTSPSSQPAAHAPDPSAQKAQTLLKKMVQALGGEAFLNYQTMTIEGRTYSFYQGRPSSVGVLYWRFWKYPDKDRVEMTKQRDVTYIYNGESGYETTFKGTARMEQKDLDDYLRRRHYSMEQVMRVWLKEPGTLVLYDGTGLADRTYIEKVTIINKDNEAVTLGIDPNNNLPVLKSFTYRDPFDGLKTTEDETYGAYRTVQGVQTPFSIVRIVNGLQANQRFLTKVEYNAPLADTLFEAKETYDPYKMNKQRGDVPK